MLFMFKIYDERAEFIRTETASCEDKQAAKAKAGRLAKQNGGPVDLAYDRDGDWADDYITTASPCDIRKCGYRLERLA